MRLLMVIHRVVDKLSNRVSKVYQQIVQLTVIFVNKNIYGPDFLGEISWKYATCCTRIQNDYVFSFFHLSRSPIGFRSVPKAELRLKGKGSVLPLEAIIWIFIPQNFLVFAKSKFWHCFAKTVGYCHRHFERAKK